MRATDDERIQESYVFIPYLSHFNFVLYFSSRSPSHSSFIIRYFGFTSVWLMWLQPPSDTVSFSFSFSPFGIFF